MNALNDADWTTVGDMLTDDFTYRYRDSDHQEFEWFSGRGVAVDRLRSLADGIHAVQHYLSNSVFTADGDAVLHRVNDMAYIAPAGIQPGDPLRLVGGVWTFTFVGGPGEWFISSLLSHTVVMSPWSDDLSSYPPRGQRTP